MEEIYLERSLEGELIQGTMGLSGVKGLWILGSP